jgi:hypothetical protein
MKKNSLKDRLKKDYESKDRGAGSRPSAMDWKKIDDVKFFKPKEGKNIIDIVPYIIKTKNDPLVKTGDAKIGDQSYMLDLFIHSNIGPTQASIICLKETFGKPCPICEQRQAFYNESKKTEAGALRAKRVCFYNVRPYEKRIVKDKEIWEPTDELMIWNISHFLFQKELIEEAKASSDDGGIIDFVDINDGKSISFRAAETESNINDKNVKFFEYKSFSFKNRKESLDESWLKRATQLDSLMILHSYEEAKKILYGDDDEENIDNDEDEDTNSDDEDEDVDDDDTDDEEDADESDEDKEEESDEDEEDDEPAPKAKAKPVAKKTTIGKPVTVFKCPSKHIFGKDCDKFPDDCSDCDDWADCAKEQKKLKAKK